MVYVHCSTIVLAVVEKPIIDGAVLPNKALSGEPVPLLLCPTKIILSLRRYTVGQVRSDREEKLIGDRVHVSAGRVPRQTAATTMGTPSSCLQGYQYAGRDKIWLKTCIPSLRKFPLPARGRYSPQ